MADDSLFNVATNLFGTFNKKSAEINSALFLFIKPVKRFLIVIPSYRVLPTDC